MIGHSNSFNIHMVLVGIILEFQGDSFLKNGIFTNRENKIIGLGDKFKCELIPASHWQREDEPQRAFAINSSKPEVASA